MERQRLRYAARPELVTAGDWLESPALSRFVTRLAGHYSLSEDDVPDLLQETRIALWRLGTATNVSAAWLFRVISNKAVDLVRQLRRARACDRTLAQTVPGGFAEPDLEHLLHARVAELPARLRDFYRLRYVEGWSEREIASQLGLCRSSIRWLDHSCRNRIVGQPKPTRASYETSRTSRGSDRAVRKD